ncbi:heat shock 70 kDa protein 16-like isoform X2 [Rutidosis leptorrhynchoides]|uniref:heat shock 70 kDa protein 16-like isoform X2 n=1 Tax=Rutidosis leptorrhynchoides TaxID=125765 RepID=UPI003A9963D4
MSAIGFDIGNENFVIAAEKRGGIDVLLNYGLKRVTPGVVSFGENQRFFGSEGAAAATDFPKSSVTQIKKLIGRQFKDRNVQKDLKLLPFETSEGPRGGILIHLQYLEQIWTFTPFEILAMLFAHVKQMTEINLESRVEECVIGIPSYFTDLQRREYLDAALMAGLKPLRLMHDCTAIALAYGMHKTDFPKPRPTNVIFVDIGHCDTQVTVAAFDNGQMKILSHSYDQNLGGRDFDKVLFKHFATQFKEEYNINFNSNTRACIRLRAACEKLKKVLSVNEEAPLRINRLIGDTDVKGFITREQFEILSLELLERISIPCINAVKDSGLIVDKIYAIELAGSGSLIPAISKKLTSILWKEPRRAPNASEYVARGCALQCAMLMPTHQVKDYKVLDLFPYSIGCSVGEDEQETEHQFILFPKGSRFPSDQIISYPGNTTRHFQVFYTNKTDIPAGISPKVGCFLIGSSETNGVEKVKVELKVKLSDLGIFEIETASLLEDKGPARNIFSSAEKILANNLPISKNLYFSTIIDELTEAQEKRQMLAEQDIKAEKIKDEKNTLEYFIYSTSSKAYETTKGDTRKNEALDPQQMSAEHDKEKLFSHGKATSYPRDESEQNHSEKHEDLKELLYPVIETTYQDENARAQGTKPLLTCIADYRSIADSLSPTLKQKVNEECNKAQQWLNDHSQQPNIVDPILWANIIKYSMDSFERNQLNYKSIMLSSSSGGVNT